jgi:RHS repeat-associated protein
MRMVEERIHRGKLDRFSYDWKMRLINAKLGIEKNNPDLFEKQISYVLDLVDNIRRITETKDSTTTTIETTINNRNQYTKFGNLNLSYDSNGNLKQKGNKNFSYDYKNQLVKYTDPDKTVEFRYDPFGRRIQKKVELNNSQSSQITNYYHEGYRVIEERDNSDRVTKQYVYGSGIDEILRMDIYQNQTSTPYYLHHNLIGSITGITDENGNLIELVEYDPYGKPYFLKPTGNPQNPYESSESSTIGNTTLFQGREYDSETGLYYFRARYYDPELGRFLQPDPKGYVDSMNLYQAFNLNPINFIDPFGKVKIISKITIHEVSSHEIATATKGWTLGGYFKPEKFEVEYSIEEIDGLFAPRVTIYVEMNIYIPKEGDPIYGLKGAMGLPKSPKEALEHELGHALIGFLQVSEVYRDSMLIESIRTKHKFVAETAIILAKIKKLEHGIRYIITQKLYDFFGFKLIELKEEEKP